MTTKKKETTFEMLSKVLDKVEKSIRDEVNIKGSEKAIKQLKERRESFLSEYNKLKNKLNDNKKEGDNI